MERALKERIIGAVVLVIFVVLVVPIFLDGPPTEAPIVSERLLLPGQEAQDTKMVVLDRERSVPIPAASNAAESTPPSAEQAAAETETTPKPLVAAATETSPAAESPTASPTSSAASPAAEPIARPVEAAADSAQAVVSPTASPTVPAASATGMWAVQLGSFSNKENAEALAANLRKQGYAAFLSRTQNAGNELHRVRIGPQKDRESAEQMAARLAKVGHRGQVLPHP